MNKVQQKVKKIIAHSRPVVCGEYSVDGAYVFTASHDSLVRMYCAYTGEELDCLGPHNTSMGTAISSISISSDCRFVAVGSKFEVVTIHDRTNRTKQSIPIPAKGARFVQFSKDSSSIFIGTTTDTEQIDGESRQINAQLMKFSFPGLELIQKCSIPHDPRCCVMSPDDSMIVVGTVESVQAFNTLTLKTEFEEEFGDKQIVCDLQIYRNGFVVVPVSDSQRVYFYNLRTKEEVYSIKVHNRVNTAAVNPMTNVMVIGGGLDPKLVAKTKEGNNILAQYYDIVTKQIVLEQELHAAPTHKLRWSPDGMGLLSVSEDGSIAIMRFSEEILQYKFEPEWVE